ncbi:MAG: hypothetical protein HOU01_19905, partial [Streptomycetaceae bacterium]|nr:hypothetical protein [Streptomycetaceae bacterium]
MRYALEAGEEKHPEAEAARGHGCGREEDHPAQDSAHKADAAEHRLILIVLDPPQHTAGRTLVLIASPQHAAALAPRRVWYVGPVGEHSAWHGSAAHRGGRLLSVVGLHGLPAGHAAHPGRRAAAPGAGL